MAFRFQIRETGPAKPPIVVLIGDLLEGTVRVGDRIAVPLQDGGSLVCLVFGLLPGVPDRIVEVASVDDQYAWLGIGVRRDGQRIDDIALGVATSATEG